MTDFMRVATDFIVIAMILVGVWQFRTPRGALRGNGIAAAALALAIYLVAVRNEILSPGFVTVLIAVGAVAGFWLAKRVKMIQAPAMVAIQHGAGGLGAFLVCSIELMRGAGPALSVEEATGIAGLAIGGATFSGSLVAGGKLANVLSQPPQIIRGHGWWLSAVVVALAVAAFAAGGAGGTALAGLLVVSVVLAAVVGILVAVRIGGADMPVLISFLNATAGVAAAFTGVVIGNNLLVAGGATVAASGTRARTTTSSSTSGSAAATASCWPRIVSMISGQGIPSMVSRRSCQPTAVCGPVPSIAVKADHTPASLS